MNSLLSSDPLYRHVRSRLEQILHEHQPVSELCVALSGGADSMALLHMAANFAHEINFPIRALYVHHGLSKNADQWQVHCQYACSRLNVPFKAVKVNVHEKPRHSLEAQAREARYEALTEETSKLSVVLLGQHANDQLETILLRLQRGTGLLGLGGMAASRRLVNGAVCFRPLLAVTKAQIESFITTYQIKHITDESNYDERFARNFLRNKVIPLWQTIQPGLLQSITRAAELIKAQQALLDEYTQADLDFANDNGKLCIEKLRVMSLARQNNLLRAWLESHGQMMPSKAILDQIRCQAIHAKQDAKLDIQLAASRIKRFRNKLYCVKPAPILSDYRLVIDEPLYYQQGCLMVDKDVNGICSPCDDQEVWLRFDRLHDRIHLAHKPGSNTIKHWLKDAGIPSWERPYVPVIYYNDTPVQIIGIGYAKNLASEQGVSWSVVPPFETNQ
ncbi:tRNA(Ile)-lysidine synthetase [Pseudoalteromonas luteoviolacea B = ATCC 29581]|nr:tRNA(Ile)-lysidine synthetase [Pseudoalteromonas luteoviolacea B = ATCC 29581]